MIEGLFFHFSLTELLLQSWSKANLVFSYRIVKTCLSILNLTLVDVRVGQKAIEHILPADEHLSQDAHGKVVSIYDGEESEHEDQLSSILHLPLVKRDMGITFIIPRIAFVFYFQRIDS